MLISSKKYIEAKDHDCVIRPLKVQRKAMGSGSEEVRASRICASL